MFTRDLRKRRNTRQALITPKGKPKERKITPTNAEPRQARPLLSRIPPVTAGQHVMQVSDDRAYMLATAKKL